MKVRKTVLCFLLFPLFFAGGLTTQAQRNAQPAVQTKKAEFAKKLRAVLANQFGQKVVLADQEGRFHLTGDFNGDGFQDIAILTNVEEGRESLKDLKVKYIDVDFASKTNGRALNPTTNMGQHCLGVALIHGTAIGWDKEKILAKFLFYDCFSGFRIVRKGQTIRRGAASKGKTPIPVGDSIQLDLETGAQSIVYWDGHRYKGFGQRGGC